jgi:hypothetical protein
LTALDYGFLWPTRLAPRHPPFESGGDLLFKSAPAQHVVAVGISTKGQSTVSFQVHQILSTGSKNRVGFAAATTHQGAKIHGKSLTLYQRYAPMAPLP